MNTSTSMAERVHFCRQDSGDIPCCHIGCDQLSTVVIQTVREDEDNSNEIVFAGPDPLSDCTYSCDLHVGALLGHQPDADDPEGIFWEVYPLGRIDGII